MAIHRRPRPAGLRLELIDLLLDGHCRRPDENDPRRCEANYDPFCEFDELNLRALWLAYRDELLREWTARGGRGRPWAARQFDPKGSRR